jgi:hypothetical protein
MMAPPRGARPIAIYVKPHKGDVLILRDGTRRQVLKRVDHCSGTTSVLLDNPTHWVFDVMWFLRFHHVKIEKNGENA